MKQKKDKISFDTKNKYKKQFCNFHQTNSHDRSNCRALKKSYTTRKVKGDTGENEKINSFIQEPKANTQLIELETKINGKNYNFLFDPGSVLSYIDEKIILENEIEVENTSKCIAKLVDGTKFETSKEATLKFNIQGYEKTTYKTKMKILKNMSLNGILGMNFLLENDACINLSEGTLSLDKKHYEIKIDRNTNEYDTQLISKTHINANIY
ncbi:hypothetical protein DMUE_0183 [Dictyocoela muelleri]|nr:hypothetical protein DMUE_0183 [Dictyocoela muelleri]